MKIENLKNYRCPISGDKLEIDKSSMIIEDKIIEGILLSKKH